MQIAGKSTLYNHNIPLSATPKFTSKEKSYLENVLELKVVVCPDCGKIPEIRLHQYADEVRYISALCNCKSGSARIKREVSRTESLRRALNNWNCN